MPSPVPDDPKIYHIVHVDRLPSIIADGQIWSDAEMARRPGIGTSIGMAKIKQRRLEELTLGSHPGLHVGECVPFNFCPRSVMLYVIYRMDHAELGYRGGQGPILHLEADLLRTVEWADAHRRRWAFTSSTAGSFHFEDYADIGRLGELDWDAIQAPDWQERRDSKQAEFLVEQSFPWGLISRIGVQSLRVRAQVMEAMRGASHCPPVVVRPRWYYGGG